MNRVTNSGEMFAIGCRIESGNQGKPENKLLVAINLQRRHLSQFGSLQQTYTIGGKAGTKRAANTLRITGMEQSGRLGFLRRGDIYCSKDGKGNLQTTQRVLHGRL